MSYSTEFPQEYAVPADLLALLADEGWEDNSWGNDACPSFIKGDRCLWIQPEKREDREFPDCDRFSLETFIDDANEDQVLWSTEELETCIRRLAGM